MATKTKVIHEQKFEINWPYEAGHVINEAEAKALNQTRSENIGNNVRAKVKEMLEAGKSAEEISAYVAEIDAGYTFTLANVGASRKLDPVEKEAQAIARTILRDHLAKTGRKLTVAPEGVTEEDWKEKIESETDRIATLDAVVAQAKKNVDAKKKAADKIMEAVGEIAA